MAALINCFDFVDYFLISRSYGDFVTSCLFYIVNPKN